MDPKGDDKVHTGSSLDTCTLSNERSEIDGEDVDVDGMWMWATLHGTWAGSGYGRDIVSESMHVLSFVK